MVVDVNIVIVRGRLLLFSCKELFFRRGKRQKFVEGGGVS